MNDWRIFADAQALDRALAEHIAAQLKHDITAHDRASLAVSGGATPRPMFQYLSRRELDWPSVWISLVDERWVAADSPDSNERLVRDNLLQNQAGGAHFVSLKSAQENASDGLPEVEQRLAEIPQPFSVVVLGMGGDGHTASWFPRAANLEQLLDPQGAAALGATDPLTAEHQRITLTLPAVLRSRGIVIHITGEEKRSVLESAGRHRYPVAAILEQKTTPVTIWWAP